MSAPHQILLYWRERGEAFLARAHAHALEHRPGLQIVQRNPQFFGWDSCEATAAGVYVESCFEDIVIAYRERGVSVVTDTDLSSQGVVHEAHDQNDGEEAASAQDGVRIQDGQHTEGQGPLGQVTPITTARRRGRPRRVA